MSKTGLPNEIKAAKYLIEWFMTEVCGLEPFFFRRENGRKKRGEIIFEVYDCQKLYEVAAYGGFPVRYPHYQFGLEYNRLMKGQTYGLSKIYELVINNDPVFAYLLSDNHLVDQKLVMAHVYAHADFFVNNVYFAGTSRKAVDMMANHAVRVRQFQDEHGAEEVEKWLDVCLSLDNLIDIHLPALKRADNKDERLLVDKKAEGQEQWDGRFPAKDYMNGFINPPTELEDHRRWLKEKQERAADIDQKMIFPPESVRDVLLFLAENAPIKPWQREILFMIREERYYYAPQAQTKIMNEGWAAYWHSVAMTELLSDAEIIDYAEHNSGTLASHQGRINPYLVGREIFRDIVYRWDTHRRGEIYRECDDCSVLLNWNQFVAFKNIYEECGGCWEKMEPRWREFLCFWRAVRDPERLCGAVYDSALLLRWWHFYQNIDQILKKQRMLVGSEENKIRYYKRLIADRGADWPKREFYEAKKAAVLEHLPYQRRSGVLLKELAKLREQFRAGQLEPEQFCLADGFWKYAGKYSGELPIAQGREKIFEVRKFYCDLTFIEEFLTAELCRRLKLFSYNYEEKSGYYVIDSREADDVRRSFCQRLANVGQPVIVVKDGNFSNSHELFLEHRYEGVELKKRYAESTLENLHKIWRRPVHIKTYLEEAPVRMSYDGQGHHSEVTN